MANYPPYMAPQQQMYPTNYMLPQQDALISRLVASREEAVAMPTDFNRPIIMPDFSHGAIYVKRFNPNTGAGELLDFRYSAPVEAAPAVEYVTKQEFNQFCADLMKRIARAGREDTSE